MVEISMIKQLMTRLNNMMKSEKCKQDKVMITQLVFLLDFAYFEKEYRLIAVDLSKQKALDADPKAIQQIIFTGKGDDEALTFFYILEKSKETMLQFSKGTTKVL